MSALAGRRVLVTGASGAFGQAVSTELRERGAEVAGLDLAGDEDADVIACDLTSPTTRAAVSSRRWSASAALTCW